MENYDILNKLEKQGEKKSLILKSKLFFKQPFKYLASEIKNSDFLGNKIIFWLLTFNFFANIANWSALAIFMNKIDGNVILHYNVYFGVDKVGYWKSAFLMPFIGVIVFFINVFLAAFFHKNQEKVASYVLLLGLLMVQIGFIIASISIIIINY